MAKIVALPVVEVTTQFTVTEAELRALEALAGYGDDAFIKMFYKDLGECYLRKHEAGLREFLKSIRTIAMPILSKADKAREIFK